MSIRSMKQALEALEKPYPGIRTNLVDAIAYRNQVKDAITSLRQAIADAEKQEPVAVFTGKYWIDDAHDRMLAEVVCYTPPNAGTPTYTHPQPAQPKAELSNLERHEQNVRNFLGDQKAEQKPIKWSDYESDGQIIKTYPEKDKT